MKIVRRLSRQESLEIYLRENANIRGPGYRLVKRVFGRSRSGYLVKFNQKEIEKIIMPNPFFCNCGNHFSLREMGWKIFAGLNLKELFLKIASNKAYALKYPLCWEKVELQRKLLLKGKQSTIFLSKGRPLFFSFSYIGMTRGKNNIFLVEGFHRLLALMLLKCKPHTLRFILIK